MSLPRSEEGQAPPELSPTSPAAALESHAPDVACLALVQAVETESLRSRVPAALARGLALLESVAVRAAGEAMGRIVPSGASGILVRFDDPLDAVRFALRVQLDLLELEWPPTLLVRPEAAEERGPDGRLLFRGLRVRIAIHRGRTLALPEGGIVGPAVYQVARVAAAAHGGQVVMTEAAWRRLRGGLSTPSPDGGPPGAVVIRDLGQHKLAGVDGATRLLQVLPEALDRRAFPEVVSEEVRRSNLVSGEEPVVGRQGDLAALSELVALGVRLVTVLGPPGVGRSRLVRQFARSRLAEGAGEGGVWLVRPSEPTVAGLARAVGQVLAIPLDDAPTEAHAVDRLAHALAARGPVLFVIDALPNPAEAVRETLDGWLRLAPGAVFVVNTDRRFNLRGEIAYALGPLAVPAGDLARHADAVRMYSNRARVVDEDFVLEDPAPIGEIVGRVGGLPLAIRLLAGVVDRLPPDRQLERLRSGELHPERLIESVLELLDPDERRVLATCAALPGSFEPEVLDEPGMGPVLQRLERRGLVRFAGDAAAPGVQRHVVDERVRVLALALVPEEDRMALVARRAQSLTRALEPWSSRAQLRDRPEVVARLALEWEGLVEIVRLGTDPEREDPEGVDLATRVLLVLRPLLEARGPLFVALHLLDAVLHRSDAVLGADPVLQIRALVMRAETLRRAGRLPPALVDLDRAQAIAERWSDREGTAMGLVERGRNLSQSGAPDLAMRALEDAISQYRELGDVGGEGTAGAILGVVCMESGRYPEAEARLRTAVAQLRDHDLRVMEARALTWLGTLFRRTGRFDEARSLLRESIRLLHECGIPGMESRARSGVGLLDLQLGRLDEAIEVLATAAATARWAGDRGAEGVARRYQGIASIARDDFDAAREHLLAAMAIDRDLGDRHAEGADAGALGWLHHLADQPDPARDAYRRALALLEESGERRLEALYTGWLSGLEAERDEAVSARALYEVALLKQADSGDPQVGETLIQLRSLLDLMESRLCPDPAEAERWRAAAASRHAEAAARRTPLPGSVRFAHDRVGRLLGRPNG